MMNKLITKKNVFILFILIVVCFFSIRSTYAKFIQGYTTPDDIVDYSYDLDFNIKSYSDENNINEDKSYSTVEEYELVSVKAHGYSLFNVDVTNSNNNDIYYGIWYKNLTDIPDDKYSVSMLSSTSNSSSGSLESNETKTTTIIVKNNSSHNLKIKIGVASDNESVNNIIYYDNRKLISIVVDYYTNNQPNEPILDYGMIPVNYDEKTHLWIKANYNNKNNSWYDYENKKWANVVLIKDDVRDKYMKASIGSSININDVVAFYVWIPRFKYRVWNINRQIASIDNYSYNAKDDGIQIIFEKDSNSTGNVNCNYDIHTSLNNNSLSDYCNYESNKVDFQSRNSVFIDAWYTHPAFGDNLSGFWIGKFETTGSKESPTIIPDSKTLTNIDLSNQFAISKKFNNFGLSDMDSRIIKNIEWGAVTYLTHSIYGLCDSNKCSDVYLNNSTNLYTGRSSGNNNINDKNDNGTYSYEGYKIIDNKKSSEKNDSKIASTTGNITGVYDMSGGAMEHVMSNIVNTSFSINMANALDDWNKDKYLDEIYYELYSYIDDSANKNSYYKTRLGDATSELTINGAPWNNTIVSLMGNKNNPWIIRGFGSNLYGYAYSDGSPNENYTFRSVIS